MLELKVFFMKFQIRLFEPIPMRVQTPYIFLKCPVICSMQLFMGKFTVLWELHRALNHIGFASDIEYWLCSH
jgi:hypothetical protein